MPSILSSQEWETSFCRRQPTLRFGRSELSISSASQNNVISSERDFWRQRQQARETASLQEPQLRRDARNPRLKVPSSPKNQLRKLPICSLQPHTVIKEPGPCWLQVISHQPLRTLNPSLEQKSWTLLRHFQKVLQNKTWLDLTHRPLTDLETSSSQSLLRWVLQHLHRQTTPLP